MSDSAHLDYRIESHEDDSVTLRIGTVEALISGRDWKEANRAAHMLARNLQDLHASNNLLSRLSGLHETVAGIIEEANKLELKLSALYKDIEEI